MIDDKEKKFLADDEHSTKQIVVSYELLCLLKWLKENELLKLKHIVRKSFSAGLVTELQKNNGQSIEDFSLEDIQEHITEFFYTLEGIMFDTLNEYLFEHALEKDLIPAIERLDSSVCDNNVIRSSLERASTKKSTTNETAQDLFLKEVLRRWKPNKKSMLN